MNALDALGDVLRTTSILPAILEKFPDAQITWITKKSAFSILENNPYIHRKFAIEENYLQYVLNESFDLGICLDADPTSATVVTLATCKKKMGFIVNGFGQVIAANDEAEHWYNMGVNDQLKVKNRESYQSIIYNICCLSGDIKKPQFILNDKSKEFSQHFYSINNLGRFRRVLGINTGGGKRWQLKKWLFENYVELIKMVKKDYPDIGIVLLGGPEEREFNKVINQKVGDLIIDSGCNNSIQDFAGIVNLTDILFTPDSLGMHISIALNKTTIVTVGPTSPWELTTYDNGEIIYNSALDCISCYRSTCDLDNNCMSTLTTEIVYSRIKRYL